MTSFFVCVKLLRLHCCPFFGAACVTTPPVPHPTPRRHTHTHTQRREAKGKPLAVIYFSHLSFLSIRLFSLSPYLSCLSSSYVITSGKRLHRLYWSALIPLLPHLFFFFFPSLSLSFLLVGCRRLLFHFFFLFLFCMPVFFSFSRALRFYVGS